MFCKACGKNLGDLPGKFCQYCGAAFIVEKAINNYNITNNTTNNISAGVVNIFQNEGKDFIIRAGKLEKYEGASTDVVIPNTVKIIMKTAFENCRADITSVSIPPSVTVIEDWALSECENLTKIILQFGFTGIANHMFINHKNITTVIIPDSVTFIGAAAFLNCSKLTSAVIPKSVTEIKDMAFMNCGFTSIIIPDGVTNIGDNAFSHCSNLESVKIPDSVIFIAEDAFSGCDNIKNLDISEEKREFFRQILKVKKTEFELAEEEAQNRAYLEKSMALAEERARQGLCKCGGAYSGFPKKCKVCGTSKSLNDAERKGNKASLRMIDRLGEMNDEPKKRR